LILNLIPLLAAVGAIVAHGERLRWPEILVERSSEAPPTAAAVLDDSSPSDTRSPVDLHDAAGPVLASLLVGE
jgi:hypothetical protein